jgi:hypothetical protein
MARGSPPELGFRSPTGTREREKRMTVRVFCGSGKLLIAEEERQWRSWRDDEDRQHPHCHRAAWRPREDDDLFSLNPKRYLG